MDTTDILLELDRLRSLKNKEREAALCEMLQDETAQQVCYAALDPFTRYGINKVPMPTTPATLNWQFGDATWRLLDDMAARRTTGNAALDRVSAEMLQLSTESRELLRRILTKDLRCGAGPKTFNKVRPGFVSVFEMQTCHGYEEKRITSWPVVCEIKYDGTRVACVWEDQTLTIVSRNGLPMPGFETFAAAMQERMHTLAKRVSVPDMVLDGEMDSAEGFYETVGGARRKTDHGEFVLRLFDAVSLQSFRNGGCKAPWRQRCTVARTLVQALSMDTVTFDTGMECYDDEQVRRCFEWAREHGHEGIIVKQPDAPYECKRGYHWTKIKPQATVDVPAIRVEEGTGKNAGRMGAVVCDLDGVEVRVGTGWSDKERDDIYASFEDYRMRMLEIEYAEKTPDGSLRHPRALRWRADKYPEDGPGV